MQASKCALAKASFSGLLNHQLSVEEGGLGICGPTPPSRVTLVQKRIRWAIFDDAQKPPCAKSNGTLSLVTKLVMTSKPESSKKSNTSLQTIKQFPHLVPRDLHHEPVSSFVTALVSPPDRTMIDRGRRQARPLNVGLNDLNSKEGSGMMKPFLLAKNSIFYRLFYSTSTGPSVDYPSPKRLQDTASSLTPTPITEPTRTPHQL